MDWMQALSQEDARRYTQSQDIERRRGQQAVQEGWQRILPENISLKRYVYEKGAPPYKEMERFKPYSPETINMATSNEALVRQTGQKPPVTLSFEDFLFHLFPQMAPPWHGIRHYGPAAYPEPVSYFPQTDAIDQSSGVHVRDFSKRR